MDFSLSPKATEYAEKLQAFMEKEVFPAESTYHSQREAFFKAGTPHKLPPIVEELKKKARAQGLWNLFLPHLDHGLSVTDYASLAEITGWSPIFEPVLKEMAITTSSTALSGGQLARWMSVARF